MLAGSTRGQTQNKAVDFNRDIRPILSDNCFACHGPDDKQRMAGLRLDTREGAFASEGVIVPGDTGASRLIRRVSAEQAAARMPPPNSGRTLSSSQISLLRQWVAEGAKWETHWAYLPPQRIEPPPVADKSWPRNPIDNFILARLEREGLRPSPAADKAALLRRVSLDLTGLPPTPAELDSFLADPSPHAYEKRVDALLLSSHYGERMALPWLDISRYADTHGYHIDSHRDMWRWRDWVIGAFNRNLPFNQFTIEQLAGDLLPDATTEQKIASGFNRNHMINFEGGAIPEEYQVEYVVDRVEATSTAWMGMTMGCARCHSHKYDPILHKDFYQFFAFFNTVSEEGLDGRTGNAKPMLELPSPLQESRRSELKRAIEQQEGILVENVVAAAQAQWEREFSARVAPAPREGLEAHYEMDGSFTDVTGRYRHGRTMEGDPTFEEGRVGRGVNFDGDTHVRFGDGSVEYGKGFSLAFWLRGAGNTPATVFQKCEDAVSRRGFELAFDELELIGIQKRAAHFTFRLISHWPESAIQIKTRELLPLGKWHHLTIVWDGSGKASGLRLYLNGKPFDTAVLQDNLTELPASGAELEIGNKQPGKAYRGKLDDLRIYNRPLSSSEIEQIAIHYPIQAILSGVTGKRTEEEAERCREYFLERGAAEHWRKAHAELKTLRRQLEDLEDAIPTAMIMDEMEKPRETHVLGRGDYRNKGEKVTPGVPAVLPALPEDAPLNRLTLARWLVDPAHPLTARVAVNRYWQMYFGTGIVKTAEDFGSQGDLPSHPGLLDWLATEFIRTQWDIKAMQRLIVTSATYRQSSRVTPELLEKDPENRLLARGARFRLPAEFVRDNALATSGLLNDDVGGPSVFPYQPTGLWEELAFGDGFSAQSYNQGHGSSLYRRSLYTFWKRTAPPPSLLTFDAPDREKCTARRPLTNTPLQALVLLNDPTYVEAARALAARTLREGGNGDPGRLRYVFRLATGRVPSAAEISILRDLLDRQRKLYRVDKTAAEDLLRIGESTFDAGFEHSTLAAWTAVASALLNLDETITKQ
jgi:hypothetical protein